MILKGDFYVKDQLLTAVVVFTKRPKMAESTFGEKLLTMVNLSQD